jgi:ADP-ribose pyrophosphatase
MISIAMIEKFHKTQFSFQGSAVGFKCDQVRLHNGKLASREYLTHPGAVAILPFLDSPREVPLLKCRIVLVEQFRYPVRRITLELPAGKIDAGESPRKCLARELKEETGYSTARFNPLISYEPTPAFSQEVIHVFWADRLKKGKSRPDEDEFLRVRTVRFGEMLEKVRQGRIRDSKTALGIVAFAAYACVSKSIPVRTLS